MGERPARARSTGRNGTKEGSGDLRDRGMPTNRVESRARSYCFEPCETREARPMRPHLRTTPQQDAEGVTRENRQRARTRHAFQEMLGDENR